MLVYLFLFILFAHAIVHLEGFFSVFGDSSNLQAATRTTRAVALLWLLVFILFLTVLVLVLVKNTRWYWLAATAVIMSQVLIVSNWRSAKWGTILNLVILLVAIPAFANAKFNKTATIASRTILARVAGNQSTIITNEMMLNLPPVVQKWLIHSGAVGNTNINTVRLKQKGELRTSQAGKWMPFTATEYFTVNDPAFVWTAHVAMMPLVSFTGLDKFENGHGETAIKLLSIFSMASSANDYKTNTATMLRYLAETCLFPSAATNERIQWQQVAPLSAKATMTFEGITVSGIFTFTKNGDVESFTANRYYGTGPQAKPEIWLIQFEDWMVYQGYRIPCKNKITWKLATGDFYWANIVVTDVEYNSTGIYQ